MAEWRKIRRDLAFSERFHSCSERARLAYVQSYPFTDREGRLPGSLRKLYATCFAMTGWTFDELEAVIEDLVRVGLWYGYEDQPGRKVIQVERFSDMQGREHLGKEKPASKYAPPPEHGESIEPEPFRDDSGDAPEPFRESAGTDKKREEEKREEEGRIARTRVEASHEPEEKKNSLPFHEISGARRQEIAMVLDAIIADFRAAHPLGEKAIIRKWDREALYPVAHVVAELPDRPGFFRRAIAALPAHRLNLEACLEKLNDPSIVNGSLASTARIDDGQRLMAERAAHLGITPAELVERYERGEYTMPQRHKENATRVIPVLPEEESVDPARLSGMERVGAIVARAISPSRKDLE